ncbi:MAG: hypothetical protein ACXVHI_04625 [Frankiaceae bacterium]
MNIVRKLVIGGAATAVVVGVGAYPASAAPDPDLVRLYSAVSYPGGQAAIQNAVNLGNWVNAVNKNAHNAWPGQVVAYRKALAKYKVDLAIYNYWLPVYKIFHRKPPPPPKPPKAPPATRPPLTNWAQFGRIGTVSKVVVVPKKTGDKKTVAVAVTGIELGFNGNSGLTFSFDDDSALHSLALRDNGNPAKLAKVDETNIKVKDKIGVIGIRWGNSATGGLVVVKTL